MPSSTVVEIDRSIRALPLDEQLWLLEQLVSHVRERAQATTRRRDGAEIEAQLAAMASDPAIQSELRVMAQEFAATDSDGLDQL